LMPSLWEIIKPEDFIKDMATSYNIDLSSIWWMDWWIAKEKQKLFDILKNITSWWQNAPEWMPWWNMWQPQQAPQEWWAVKADLIPRTNAEPKWGLVRTPITPWMKSSWAEAMLK